MEEETQASTSEGKPKLEKCLLGKVEVVLPEALVEDVGIFMEVFSMDTWKNVLTEAQRKHLQKFLPAFPSSEHQEKQKTIGQLFGGQNFKFGNPAKQFHKKLKGGMFSQDIGKYASLCRKAKMREYRYQQQVYYGNLLKEVLINRQRILEQVYQTPPYEPIVFEHFQWNEPPKPDRCLEFRIKKKCNKFIKEVNQECGFDDTSSEDDELPSPSQSKIKKQLFKVVTTPDKDNLPPSVQATFAPKPEILDPNTANVVKRSASPLEMNEDEFKTMLLKHKRRKEDDPDHPELDTRHVTLEDIIARTQVFKKSGKANQIKKKGKEKGDGKKCKVAKVKPEVIDPLSMPTMTLSQTMPFSQPPLTLPSVEINPMEQMMVKPELNVEEASIKTLPPPPPPVQTSKPEFSSFIHFFSLLREFICEDPEGRITTMKLEEKVREWQESASSQLSLWIYDQPTWVDLVSSALKFLSGDVLGLSLENFIPYLDYKERAQQWKWIGHGRDSDLELSPLYRHWLENKEDSRLDNSADGSASPPPPRVRTSFVVRATTDEEKVQFQSQERERFENPHKAYTYELHGYESVVGPVKGVYTKDNAMNKAREHALLISERPAYVTILTLVRDAAARLPNGEGTRSDICELLKDSQFLALNVTDAQINTVVSGALDRLHYEKDPCVKYDVNRKLWIYLHRHRSLEEFERIHQAQGAAAKAKKQLQKPKPSKKVKESVTSSAVVTTVPSLTASTALSPLTSLSPATTALSVSLPTTLTRQSSILSTGSNDSIINVDTLSPASTPGPPIPSPKAQGTSPKVTPGPPVSPRTPQANPRTAGPSQKTLVSSLISQAQLSRSVQNPGHIATARGTVIGSKGGAKMVSSPGGKGVSSPQSKVSAASITSLAQGLGMSLVQSQSSPRVVTSSLLSSGGQQQVLTAGSKPFAFSLIQSPGNTKLVESVVGGQSHGQTRTVLLTSRADGTGQKIIATVQQPHTSLSGSTSPTQSPKTPTTPGASSPKSVSSPQSGGKAMVTRIVQQQLAAAAAGNSQGHQVLVNNQGQHVVMGPGGQSQQVVNVSELLAQSQAAQKQAGVIPQGATTIKIQGSHLVQGVGDGKPSVSAVLASGGHSLSNLQRTVSVDNVLHRQQSTEGATLHRAQSMEGLVPGSITSTSLEGGASPVPNQQTIQYTVSRGGKPTTMMISKPNPPGGKQVNQHAQIIHSASIGGKPLAAFGGKPIIIGGKPAMLSGKPLQIGGKPLHLIGKPGQIGLLQGVQGAQNIVTAVNLVSQASGSIMTAVPHTQTKLTHGSPNLVTQFIQSGATLVQQAKPGGVSVPHSKVATSTAGQSKVLASAQGGIVVTQIPQTLTTNSGAPGSSQTRTVNVSQGGILQGSHLIMQTGQGQPKVVTPQLLAAGGLRHQFFTQGGKPGQNIQLVKTVISQPGGKPGQTTILFAQPSAHSGTSLVSSAGQLSQATLKAVTQTTTGVKTKGGPVYARIITPPPGIRLAAVRPGQAVTPGQVGGVQGMSVIQGLSRVPGDSQVTVQALPQQLQTAVQQQILQQTLQQEAAASVAAATTKETDSSDSDQK